MRAAVAAELGHQDGQIGDREDLIRCGLDSIAIMRLANTWRRTGADVKFADLLREPTLEAWCNLVSRRSAIGDEALADSGEVDEAAPFELTPMQQAYWVGARQGHVLGSADAQYYVELDGRGVDPARLEQAIHAAAARHAMLRARFLPDGRQQILERAAWNRLPVHDHRQKDSAVVLRELLSLRQSLSHRQLAVDAGEVFDFQLSLLPNGESRLHINIAMLVCDARSFQLILEDLARLYTRPERMLPPETFSFQRYLQVMRQKRLEAYERAKSYWQARLADLPGGPLLPLAADPSSLGQHKVGRHNFAITPQQKQALSVRAREHALSLPVVFATAFAEVLAAWSAEPRFLLNMPLFDREELHPEVATLVGDFTNVILVAADVSAGIPFSEQAKRLQHSLIESAAHSEYPGVELLRDLARIQPGDGIPAPVVFTSVFGMGDLFSKHVRRCFGNPAWITSRTPQVWLDHQIMEHEGGLLLNLDFVEGLFPDGLVDDLFQAYTALIVSLSASAEQWGQPAPAMVPQRQLNTRESVNATEHPISNRTLSDRFFELASAEPDRPALAWGESGQMSYGSLSQRACSVAAALMSRGVVPGGVVAITMPRGPDQIAAVLGVLAAGAAFVPASIQHPLRRRAQIYESAGARIVLTSAAEAALPDWPAGCAVLALDAIDATPGVKPVPVPADSLAYVIYTSGSTGGPKGVEITHLSAVNTIEDVNQRWGAGPRDRILAVSSLDFDLAIYDIFGALSAGATLVLMEEEGKRDARRFLELTTRWGVTIWNSVPALLDMLLIAAEAEQVELPLRLALISGDWVGLDLPGRLAKRAPACRFVALGGATEAAIWSNLFEVLAVDPKWKSIPYGRPLRNQKFRIMDGRRRDRPDWAPGELWIGGLGVAAGYRHAPEITAERFVTHDGQRWYRTGDLGRYWSDGTIEFLGRLDTQVKIRGHRIELGEVETALLAHPQVNRAVACAAGSRRDILIAAVVPANGRIDGPALEAFLAARLPSYMVPKEILIVGEIPLTSNGKVDVKALAALLTERQTPDTHESPLPGMERAIAALWTELLGQPNIGRRTRFFDAGGDSLTATRLVATIRKQFGADIRLRALLGNPTITELSTVLAGMTTDMEEGAL
jgi:amino acid adenylation domain-containing protein